MVIKIDGGKLRAIISISRLSLGTDGSEQQRVQGVSNVPKFIKSSSNRMLLPSQNLLQRYSVDIE